MGRDYYLPHPQWQPSDRLASGGERVVDNGSSNNSNSSSNRYQHHDPSNDMSRPMVRTLTSFCE